MEPRPDEVGGESLPGPAAEAALAEREGYLLTAALSQRLDLIRHLIDFSHQIVLVVGDEGSGKTSLMHHLLATAPENWRLAKINADPMCDADALMKRLSADFDLHFSEQDDWQRRVTGFENFLGTMRRALMVPVVLVDDGHLLPADALLLLLRLAQPESEAPHLRVVMFCDPRIVRVLGSPQLQAFKDSLTHTVEMTPFLLEDTATYLARHWPAEDDASSPILDERFVRDVHAAASGIPGRINALVRTSLEASTAVAEASAPEAPRLRIGFSVLGGAVALLLAAGVWQFLREPSGEAQQTAPIIEPVPLNAPEPVAASPPPAPSVAPPEPVPPPPVTAPTIAPLPAPVQPTASPPPQPAPVEQAIPQPPPEPAPVPAETATAAAEPVAEPATTPPPAKPGQPKPPAEKSPERDRSAAASDKPGATATPKPSKTGSTNAWLLRQRKNNYVVQLYATFQRTSAQQFIASHKLGSKANVVATVRDNKTWYVVVYGPYADRAKARSAIAGLPEPVRRLKPWVRQIGDLQAIAAK